MRRRWGDGGWCTSNRLKSNCSATRLARRLFDLRSVNSWSQAELAARFGAALPAYRPFERSDVIALVARLWSMNAAVRVDRFDSLGPAWPVSSGEHSDHEWRL